jgi:hypothetical protein
MTLALELHPVIDMRSYYLSSAGKIAAVALGIFNDGRTTRDVRYEGKWTGTNTPNGQVQNPEKAHAQRKRVAEDSPPPSHRSSEPRLFLGFEALTHECLAFRPFERFRLGLGTTGFHFLLLRLLRWRRGLLFLVCREGTACSKGKRNKSDHNFHRTLLITLTLNGQLSNRLEFGTLRRANKMPKEL